MIRNPRSDKLADIQPLTIVGVRSTATDCSTITHVAILRDTWKPGVEKTARVYQGDLPFEDECAPDLVAMLDLTFEETARIKTRIEIAFRNWPTSRKPLPHEIFNYYVIRPPVKRVYDTVSNRLRHIRFSCVGFVIYCYELKGKLPPLVDLDESSLPNVTLDELCTMYPKYERMLRRPNVRSLLGIETGDSWPIALPGYVINSLERADREVRSRPFKAASLSDATYPTGS